jgi:hypothetical protein
MAAYGVTQKPRVHPVIIDIANPDALRRGCLIVLDLEDKDRALEIAKKLAAATGRTLVIRDADMVEIETIPAAAKQ